MEGSQRIPPNGFAAGLYSNGSGTGEIYVKETDRDERSNVCKLDRIHGRRVCERKSCANAAKQKCVRAHLYIGIRFILLPVGRE